MEEREDDQNNYMIARKVKIHFVLLLMADSITKLKLRKAEKGVGNRKESCIFQQFFMHVFT